jgi:hypothetical protein
VWDDAPVIVEQHLIDLLHRKIVQAGKYWRKIFFQNSNRISFSETDDSDEGY